MENQLLVESHPFIPFVPPGARFLLIGTFPGRALTQATTRELDDWYYGTHSHSLWKVLEEVYKQSLATKQEKEKLLTSLHIGITDVVAAARRRKPSNNDSDLEVVAFQTEKLAELLKNHSFDAFYFTSQQAQKWFARLAPELLKDFDVPDSRLAVIQHVLPSPSPRYIQFKHGTVEGRREQYRLVLPPLT